jgi:hypothetical protein
MLLLIIVVITRGTGEDAVFHQRGRDGGSIFFFFLFLEH